MVIDSSTLISLARSGLLGLLARIPLRIVVLDVVWDEVVLAGKTGGYVDAVAIEGSLGDLPRTRAPAAGSADERVLLAAVADGAMACNDATLGRRARNLGVRWIRTADILVLLVRSGSITSTEGVGGVEALYNAGRISEALRDEYLEVLQ